jgi:hypothetical protein
MPRRNLALRIMLLVILPEVHTVVIREHLDPDSANADAAAVRTNAHDVQRVKDRAEYRRQDNQQAQETRDPSKLPPAWREHEAQTEQSEPECDGNVEHKRSNVKMTGPRHNAAKPQPAVVGPCRLTC